ncbi:MAG: FAD-dependent oxidoreductase [Myxococcaceae bacterium]
MARTTLFDLLRSTVRTAATEAPAQEAVELRQHSRRSFVRNAALLGAGVVAAKSFGAPLKGSLKLGIVGGGLAGLTTAYELKRSGVIATVHEASGRAGGRCFSMGGRWGGPVNFPGQVIERGGELIDTGHKSMLGYANEFNLATENYVKAPGEVFYRFFDQMVPEATVIDEFRAFVPVMQDDLRKLTGSPTFFDHTAADVALDRVSIREYLVSRGASRLLTEVICETYEAEYGLAADQQSCFNLLHFIRLNRQGNFEPFGVSDERYHLVDGNEGVPRAMADRLGAQVRYGEYLESARKTAAGAIELTFRAFNKSLTFTYDAVVFAVPFSVLRTVNLDASLGLSADKRRAINTLGYGTNAKTMIGFKGPFWRALGNNGATYSDQADHQATWETNRTYATATDAVLTDYSSAARGANLSLSTLQQDVAKFLTAYERVCPGAKANVKRDAAGNVVAWLEHWPSNPLSRGSYTCYTPGQFTGVAGLEGTTEGSCFFAGEHANSFYAWQGYMEGACLSGKDAAAAVLAVVK